MDLVHERGSMDLVHESGPWTWSKVGVHGPLVHVLSSPQEVASSFPTYLGKIEATLQAGYQNAARIKRF